MEEKKLNFCVFVYAEIMPHPLATSQRYLFMSLPINETDIAKHPDLFKCVMYIY